MSASSKKPLKATDLYHRALLALMPAFGFGYAAYENGFAWFFTVPALVLLAIGVTYLVRGSQRFSDEQRQAR